MTMPPKKPNRASRRAESSDMRREGKLDTAGFLKVAGKFIDVANRENQAIAATELHMAFLYAAARYNAYVGNIVIGVEDHEAFVADMTKAYQEMLRQHLADPGLKRA
jgi:non-ribosomal peptide synthetase component E (peptide arylation enzyme)